MVLITEETLSTEHKEKTWWFAKHLFPGVHVYCIFMSQRVSIPFWHSHSRHTDVSERKMGTRDLNQGLQEATSKSQVANSN